MDERATGLIMRTRPLTETSLIVHWITPDLGRLATVTKGARRPKSPFRGKLDLFHVAQMSFQRSRRGDLHHLREVQIESTFPRLRSDLDKLNRAAYAIALIEQTTETETPLEGIYHLLISYLSELNESPLQALSFLAFELKLLKELGLEPDLSSSGLLPGTKALLRQMMVSNWRFLHRMAASSSQTEEMDRFLKAFMVFHLPRVPKRPFTLT